MDTTSLPKTPEKVARMAKILAEAETRYLNELTDDEERMMLLDRIKRLRRRLETASETAETHFTGLERG